MFDGRHCKESDYKLLEQETSRIIDIISSGSSFDNELNIYLKLVDRFDRDTSDELRFKLSKGLSTTQMVNIINKYIDVLKQQVLVDIQEHSI